MQRDCIARLLQALTEQRKGHMLLDGWAGSGKSCALFAAVAWARANGWLTLYVPSAFSLTQGGLYFKSEDGLWDTPWAARYLLQSVQVREVAGAGCSPAGCRPACCCPAQRPGPTCASAGPASDRPTRPAGSRPAMKEHWRRSRRRPASHCQTWWRAAWRRWAPRPARRWPRPSSSRTRWQCRRRHQCCWRWMTIMRCTATPVRALFRKEG